MIINPYAFGGGGAGQSYISLLHFDGADASTTFTDQSGKTWTASSAVIDTAQSVFGGASGLFDAPSTPGLIYTADHADWDFGSGDFTLEGRARFHTMAANKGVLAKPYVGTNFSPWLVYTTATDLVFYSSSNNSSWDVASAVSIGTISIDTWYSWAVSRVASSIYLLLDGVLGNTVSFAGALLATPDPVNLGCFTTAANGIGGWIDEFRAIKGTGLYTGNYTPAGTAFPDS